MRNDSGTPLRSSRPGKRNRANEERDPSVDKRHARVNRANGAKSREFCELSRAEPQLGEGDQRHRQNDRGRGHDRRGVSVEFQFCRDARGPAPKPTKANRGLEFAASPSKQMVAGVAAPQLLRRLARRIGRMRRRDSEARDIEFVVVRPPRQFFDRASVEVAGRKIHVVKCAPRGQDVIDKTIAFEQDLPVDLGDHPQARHDVADGHVRGPLAAMDLAHGRIRGQALFRQPLVEPGQRRGELRILIAKPMHEFDREGLGKGLRATSGENDRRRFRGAPAHAKQAIRKAICLMASGAAACDLLRKPPQIFDQDDLQRYRYGPKFPDREGLNLLIRVDVGNQNFGLKAAVGVRDKRPRHAEDAGITSERTGDEFWQLAVIARRQIGADLTDLRFHQMKIVNQPLPRRRDLAPLIDRLHDRPIGRQEDRGIVGKSGGQRPAAGRTGSYGLRDRKTLRVRLEAFAAEQFLADRPLAIPRRRLPRESKEAAHCDRGLRRQLYL